MSALSVFVGLFVSVFVCALKEFAFMTFVILAVSYVGGVALGAW